MSFFRARFFLACLLSLVFLTTGCSIDSALYGVTPVSSRVEDEEIASGGADPEIVSGSTQYATASNGYVVSSSVGAITETVHGTSSSGHVITLTIQGQISPE